MASVAILHAMRKTLGWLLCESTTILACNSNVATWKVSEELQKYENDNSSSIFEARKQTLTSVAIFHAMKKTLGWLLGESTTVLAYNSNMIAR